MRCHDVDLNTIVEGQEHSAAYTTALNHLEECATCREHLDSLYESDRGSCEVTSIIRSSTTTKAELNEWKLGTEDDGDWDTTYNHPRTVPDIESLQPPVHPELLGRLGRYDVERVVGIGGMATVFKAYDSELHRIVALKVLTSHLARFESGRQRFAREARAAAAILHPNVLPIYNVEVNERAPFLVMQFVSGCSLQTRIEQSGPLPIDQVLRIAAQTAAGLAAAHQQGLVHRDVKPSNILLEEETDRVFLSDFGLARTADDSALTCTGVVAGTPRYMSPEQAAGEAIDHRSDLFSLGSVIYFMLTAQTPFNGSSAVSVLHRICNYAHEPIHTLRDDVPAEVEQLTNRLLSKKSSQRFSTAAETERELERLLALWHQGKLRLRRKPWLNLNKRWMKISAVASCGLLLLAIAFVASNFQFTKTLLLGTADPTHLADSDGKVFSGPGFDTQNSSNPGQSQVSGEDEKQQLARLAASRSPFEAIQAIYDPAGFAEMRQLDLETVALKHAVKNVEKNSIGSSAVPMLDNFQYDREMTDIDMRSKAVGQQVPLLQTDK